MRTANEAVVPGTAASWDEIQEFALSFDGYSYWGDSVHEVAARVRKAFDAQRPLPKTASILRTALFLEQRKWRHWGDEPDAAGMRYIHTLLNALRPKRKSARPRRTRSR